MLLCIQVTRPKAADEESFFKGTARTAIIAINLPVGGPLAEDCTEKSPIRILVVTLVLRAQQFLADCHAD